MRRALIATVFSLALLPASLLAANTAQACSCMAPPPPVEAARDASAVFHAKLVSVSDMPTAQPHGLEHKMFKFEVVRIFKGQLDAQVNVQTAGNSAACGREYGLPGSEWLIYARADEQGQIRDSLCSRSKLIADASADIAELEANAGTLDQPNELPTEPVGGTDSEPEPVMPPEDPAPEPVQPGKKGCSVTDGDAAPLGLLGLALGLLGSLGIASVRRRR